MDREQLVYYEFTAFPAKLKVWHRTCGAQKVFKKGSNAKDAFDWIQQHWEECDF